MTAPIGNNLAPTACEDTLQQGADNFNKHIGCTTQDDHAQYLKTCSVRRLTIDVVRLSTGMAPAASFFGNYPTLAFSTGAAAKVQWSVEIPHEMNVEKESYLFAVVGGCSASTENVRSVLDYLNTCHANGNPEAAAASTGNNLTASTTTGRLKEVLVGTLTSGTFSQNGAASFSWKRDSSSTGAGDAHPGNIHVISFQLQYYDRRASTST